MITIVDYGMGNLRSVARAFETIGATVRLTSSADLIAISPVLVLPGVGAFGEAVHRIDELGLRDPLLGHVAGQKPLLGICLGMQLLFEESEESPGVRGLGIFKGIVRKFSAGLKVPHIGWNDVSPTAPSFLFSETAAGRCCYFVHSFYVVSPDRQVAATEYGVPFSSVVQKGNTIGTQFHPEKSQGAGLELIKRFITSTTGPGYEAE